MSTPTDKLTTKGFEVSKPAPWALPSETLTPGRIDKLREDRESLRGLLARIAALAASTSTDPAAMKLALETIAQDATRGADFGRASLEPVS